MKALLLESDKCLSYMDVPDPQVEDDECLVRVKSAGICNSDLSRAFENGAYHYPLIMGHEFSGEIIECGRDVRDFLPSQKVVAFPLIPCFSCQACKDKRWACCDSYDYYGSRRDGAFAEFVSVKAWNLLRVPEGCDLSQAAVAEPLATAVHTLKSISKRSGKLLVIGAGFIGLSLAKLAEKTAQFDEIWVFDRNSFKLAIAEEFGLLTETIAVNDKLDSKFVKYFDVVIEACGAVSTYKNSFSLCNSRGQLLWVGNISGDLCFSQKEVSSVLRKEVTIQGIWNSDYQPNGQCDWTEALKIISQERWITELLSHLVPLSDTKELLEDMYNVKKHSLAHSYLKVCLQSSG